MKLRTEVAQKISEGRFRIIKELAMYVGNNATCLESAVRGAAERGECYMEHAPASLEVTMVKFKGYKSGALVVPAYIAQAALDSILREGFQPDNLTMKQLMVGLLLTRRSVLSEEYITVYFPSHWKDDYVSEIVQIAKGLL